MLHIVNKSPEQARALQSCLRMALDGHSVLLIEDGVYAATAAGAKASGLDAACKRLKVYVLAPDLEARGMALKRIDGIASVAYAGFGDQGAHPPTPQTRL